MLTLPLQRILARLAIFVMLFAALAPSVSHAIPPKASLEQISLQQICRASSLLSSRNDQDLRLKSTAPTTSQTFKASENSQPNPMPPMDASQHFEHCPFCGHHAVHWLLPPVALQIFLAKLNAPELLSVLDAPVTSTRVHFVPPSQAPPIL